ncbi:MAG: hypothetical protein KUG68_02345 [Flavobacteriaceae bacterium]|nr:hypothetical protein [Flavobacteriaceae bacterium]
MKVHFQKQIWKGKFSYLVGYETINQYKEVEFTMEFTLDNERISGTSYDDESKDYFDEPATVNGFYKEKTISFILKYPCSYFLNDNGEIELDKNNEHPDIHYLGILDDSGKFIQGTWEITTWVEDQDHYEDIIEIANGEFQMNRIK